MTKQFLTLACLLALSACAGTSVDSFKSADVKGSTFTTALVKEYKSFVASESAQYDWQDADHFAAKGLRALDGQDVDPENPKDWNIPQSASHDIQNYYNRLSYMLNNGAKKSQPASAAKAMAKFDCWVEQQEENWQPKDISSCKGEFLSAFATLEKQLPQLAAKAKKEGGKVQTASAPTPRSSQDTIYFDFNSAALSSDDREAIRSMAKSSGKNAKLTVFGHADTSGSYEYNKNLSYRRAMAVREALITAGISAKNITVKALGESNLAVQTGDGVKEVKNRRVEIQVETPTDKIS